MLNIYKSNKIEVISELLAKELKISPPFITEDLEIAVPNYFLGKWLRERITISNQISSLYEFKTISNYTEILLSRLFPEIDMELWNFESIKWGIIDSFEDLKCYRESSPLNNWLNKYSNDEKKIDGDIYNLAKKIAKNFVDYLIFRPEMISDWSRYHLNSPKLFNNLNSNELWQPILYKLLEKKISEKPPCLYMMEIIKDLRKLKNQPHNIPNQIYVISDNNLSKLHLNFFLKISELTKVNLYFLSAGENLWNRINIIEGEVNFGENPSQFFVNNYGIENVFGRFGGNFQKLIEETTNNEDINLNNNQVYIDPTFNLDKNKDIPLLNQIQKKLIDNNELELTINEKDDSLIFRGHISQLDQLEYVRSKIIQVLESDSDIKYSDIAIVSPRISLIKPYLRYIFNNELIIGQKIPYLFIEDDYKDSSHISNFLLDITEIASEKITLDKLEDFLSKNSTQYIYNFNFNEKDEIVSTLMNLGFHWGLDSNDRLGEETNSLEWCINRIILGLIYDEDYRLPNSLLKSFSPKNISLDLNKWVRILLQLKNNINTLRGSFNYSTWVKKVKLILGNIQDSNENLSLEISEINRVIDNYSLSIKSEPEIVLNVFREILITCINKATYKNQSRINKILVCDIEKARFIPHKVIFLIDMNSIYYPKLSNNENINLLNKKYFLGDPSLFDREKYFFIELLISCRQQLIISWANYDKENKKLDVSFPIKELLNLFESLLRPDQKPYLFKECEFEEKDVLDCWASEKSKSNYYFINKIDWLEKEWDKKNYKLSELIYWFKNPQLHWLNKKNIIPKGVFLHHPDDEYVSNFQKYQLLTKVIRELDIESFDIIDELNNLSISDQFLDNGIITPKNSLFTKEKEMKVLLESLASNLSNHNNINRIYIKSDSNKEEYLVSDNEIIELIHTKLSFNRLSEAWIRLLFISSLEKKIKRSKIIFRKENQYLSEILQSPGPLQSKKILDDYINIFKNCSEQCFPFPPESTYKYVEAKLQLKNEIKAFSERWIGNKNFTRGERDNIEMQICFGNKKEPDFFYENDNFDNLSFKVYGPLIEALKSK